LNSQTPWPTQRKERCFGNGAQPVAEIGSAQQYKKIGIDLQVRRGQEYPKSKSIKKGKTSKDAKKEASVSVLAFQTLSDRSLETGSLISY